MEEVQEPVIAHYRGRLSEFKEEKKALLVGVFDQKSSKEICHDHLDELENLCDTYGIEVIDRMCSPLRTIESATYIGSGKTQEIAHVCKEKRLNIVIFDEEISAHQQRNLEKIFGVIVIDRTELILGVFEKRAHTKEAKIQIELAQLRYQLPRLKRMWTHLSRQRTGGGSGGHLKGEGEKQIEIDKRLVKRRIHRLEDLLENVKKNRQVQRSQRQKSQIPTFAIVGYTNAGKSTLLNALTDAGVLVEDKLFATLDTTTRKYTLPNSQQVLLIDTVGFIRKIPHLLVAAFTSTMEEATEADILIHLVDIADPEAEDKIKASHKVLEELKALDKPTIMCLNKIDLLETNQPLMKLRLQFPFTVALSATTQEGFDQLTEQMVKMITLLRKQVSLKIPQSEYALVSEIMKKGQVLKLDYEGNDVFIEAQIPQEMEYKLSKYLIS